MAYPVSVKKNNYFKNRKKNDIVTPIGLCEDLFRLVGGYIEKGYILDPAAGDGRLLEPFRQYGWKVLGIEINKKIKKVNNKIKIIYTDFLKSGWGAEIPSLIICNPPFNNSGSGRKLLPELFLDRIVTLFGNTIPIILFTPMGFRLNQRKKSARRFKYNRFGPPITSIISLPLDTFKGVQFHSEILIFNLPQLKPHYWDIS